VCGNIQEFFDLENATAELSPENIEAQTNYNWLVVCLYQGHLTIFIAFPLTIASAIFFLPDLRVLDNVDWEICICSPASS